MLFTSYTYGLFVLGAFVLYYLAGRLWESRRPQNVLLLVASYGFYALFDWRWCFLLAGVTGTGLLGGYLLGGESGPGTVRRRLILSAVAAVDLLVFARFGGQEGIYVQF